MARAPETRARVALAKVSKPERKRKQRKDVPEPTAGRTRNRAPTRLRCLSSCRRRTNPRRTTLRQKGSAHAWNPKARVQATNKEASVPAQKRRRKRACRGVIDNNGHTSGITRGWRRRRVLNYSDDAAGPGDERERHRRRRGRPRRDDSPRRRARTPSARRGRARRLSQRRRRGDRRGSRGNENDRRRRR